MTDATRADQFIAGFFGPGNELSLSDPRVRESVEPWLSRLSRSDAGGKYDAALLPRKLGDRLVYYGVAADDASARELSELAVAFAGTTHARYRGRRAPVDPSDQFEGPIHTFTNGYGFKFDGVKELTRRALARMVAVLEQVPLRSASPGVPPVGRLRRDFNMAIAARNRAECERLLDELDSNRLLDPTNLLFLQVNMLGALGEWREMLTLRHLGRLVQMRRPLLVTHELIRAVYRVELAAHADNTDSLVAIFTDSIRERYAGLFQFRAGLRHPDVLKCFMLWAVAGPSQDPVLRDSLLTVTGLNRADRRLLEHLASRLVTKEPLGEDATLKSAREMFEKGDFDKALGLAYAAQHDPERAALLLMCADAVQSTIAEQMAQGAVLELGDDERSRLVSSRPYDRIWQSIRPAGSDLTPTSWLSWLQTLAGSPTWTQAAATAERGLVEWESVEDVPADTLCDLLLQVYMDASGPLGESLPSLVKWVLADSRFPRRQFAKIYRALFEIAATADRIGEDDLSIIRELLVAAFATGVDSGDYGKVCEILYKIVEHSASARYTDGLLDLSDVLIEYPCPDPRSRDRVIAGLAPVFARFRRRLTPAQIELYRLQVDDIGLAALTGTQQPPPLTQGERSELGATAERLDGQTVAIYTLSESAGRLTAKRAQSLYPGVKVKLNHDFVATEQLSQLAKTADVFVVATMSATHAATDCINQARGRLRILYPKGKGSASILAVLKDYAASANAG